ncbi:MAG: AAA family ATPase [Bacteroidales bacterium]|nr:AAA family ATPase [Bacteroidales bacterium]
MLEAAALYAYARHKEYLVPEMFLHAFLSSDYGMELMKSFHEDVKLVLKEVEDKIDELVEDTVDGHSHSNLELSSQMVELIQRAESHAKYSDNDKVDVHHLVEALLHLEDSVACYILLKHTTTDRTELMASLLMVIFELDLGKDLDKPSNTRGNSNAKEQKEAKQEGWKKLLTCVNDRIKEHNPLIGREEELERTIQVLCRKDKNNPLHVGEPGVGKTALIYGLAARIEAGLVPNRLRGARIYQMDMSTMVAGTQYRGEFEKRVKAVMEGVSSEENAIVYIDEIHTLVGSGATGEGALDGSNMLKPYLESGKVRFIGSTTYQEYNRHLQQAKSLIRRFQQIDIAEPTVSETVQILKGLKQKYEKYHGVTYAEGVLTYAAEAAARHICDRFLPDKAIDLIDEAAAYRVLHPQTRKVKGVEKVSRKQIVDKMMINDVLARICKIDPNALKEEATQQLKSLHERVSAQIYGQNEAVQKVVEAVEMGRAGLVEEGKPVASLLFVGPTGVGKTELCKVLAKEMGIGLVRFDMSEYAEKHTVAKLIGSPAGYVGYEDGGLLTDAIRKTPNCVLLLDEIEKAHSDIYNILLQVMDYARLTDNKGQKSDFRNVILVMTSNAGAQYAHQSSIGFGMQVKAGEAMFKEVKKSFKPEFLARLSDTVVFNDMDKTMAGMILDKKLAQLSARLAQRNVTLNLTKESRQMLLCKGFSKNLGAREMDRQINQLLTPLLTRAILYGNLKKGGVANVDVENEKMVLKS